LRLITLSLEDSEYLDLNMRLIYLDISEVYREDR